jgi:hypothetical protein
MKIFKLFFSIICTSIFINSTYANLPNLKITMTLVNQSKETLSYTGFTNTNPENIFLVSPTVILPGSTVTITGVSNDYNFADLSGDIHFIDSFGQDHTFHINDPQQMHYTKHSYEEEKSIATLTKKPNQPFAVSYVSII